MSQPQLAIRIAANTAELKANLAEGKASIEALGPSVAKIAATWAANSAALIQNANNITAAVQKVGAGTLNAADAGRNLKTLEAAMAQLVSTGKPIPPLMLETAEALKRGSEETSGWIPMLKALGGSFAARVAEGVLLRDAIHEILGVMKEMIVALPELAMHGSEVASVQHGFELLAGSTKNADDIMQAMRTGTRNTIPDFALMKDATKLLSAGVELTAQQFGTLTAASVVLAHRGIGETAEIMDKLSDALVTGKVKAAQRMLGIIDAKGAELDYQTALGTGTDKLTALGKAESVRIALMDKLGDLVKGAGEQHVTFAERVEQAKTAETNFMDSLGVAIATSPVVMTAMDAIGNAFMGAFGKTQADTVETLIGWVNKAAIALVSLAETGVTAGGFMVKEYFAVYKIIGDVVQVTEIGALGIEKMSLGVAKFGLATSTSAEAQKRYAADVERIQGNITSLTDAILKRGTALEEADRVQSGVDAKTAGFNKTLEELRAKMEAASAKGVTHAEVINALGAAHDQAKTQAANHTKAVEKLVDAWTGASTQAVDVEAAFGKLTKTQRDDYDVQQALIPVIDKLVASHQNVSDALMAEYNAAINARIAANDQGVALLETTKLTLLQIEALKAHGLSEQELATRYHVTADAMKTYIATLTEQQKMESETHKLALEHQKQWAAEAKKTQDEINKSVAEGFTQTRLAQIAAADFTAKETQTSTDYQVTKIWEVVTQQIAAFKGTEAQRATYNAHVIALAQAQTDALYVDNKALLDNSNANLRQMADKAWTTYEAMKADAGSYTATTIEHFRQLAQAAEDAANGIAHPFSAAFKDIAGAVPSLIQQAATGGGGVAGAATAIGSMAGQKIGTGLAESLKTTDPKFMGEALGKLVGGALPVVGSLVGPLIQALFSIGGPSAAELAGRAEQSKFLQQIDGMVTAQEKAAAGASTLAQENLHLQNTYIALGYDAETASRMAQQQMDALGKANKQGAAAVQAAEAVITKAFADEAAHAAKVSAGVDAMTAAAKTLGVKMPDALKASITELLKMPGLTDAEKTALEGLTKSAAPNYAQLTQMAATYGITLDGLGPKFQQANIDSTAKQIFNDFTALTDAGGDAGGVLLGMSKKIGDLVSDSIKFKTAIPDNMRPMLQNLVDTGQLTDTAGDKFTDMSKITFEATPLDEGLKGLQDALNALTDTLKNLPGVAAAAASAMSGSFSGVNVGGNAGAASAAAAGGLVTNHGVVRYMNMGGPVGSDTVPAWLTPGERVLSVAENKAYQSSGAGQPGGGHTVIIQAWDGQSVAQWLRHGGDREIARALAQVVI